eukprot:3000470-Rhodomonas_salina.2
MSQHQARRLNVDGSIQHLYCSTDVTFTSTAGSAQYSGQQLGTCPRCGNPVTSGQMHETDTSGAYRHRINPFGDCVQTPISQIGAPTPAMVMPMGPSTSTTSLPLSSTNPVPPYQAKEPLPPIPESNCSCTIL